MNTEKCRNPKCGFPIMLMCQKGTGYCRPSCEEADK